MSLREKLSNSISTAKEKLSKETLPSFIGSSVGNYADMPDIFGERIKSPHQEMKATREIYRNLPQVTASVEMFTDMMMGNKVTIKTSDPQGEHYFNHHILPKLKPALREAIENYIITGNGYIEVVRHPATGKPVNFIPIPESERMYIDYGVDYKPTKYILQNMLATKGHTINYYPDRKSRKHIRGDVFKPEEILHFKNGVSKIPVYGRSDFASAYDDYKIYEELQRDLAVISRWKSIAKHILTIKNVDGEPITKDEKDAFDEAMATSEDNENIITNKAVEKTDLGYNGKHENIQEHIKEINRRITSTIVPSFYLHGDVTNYAVANDQKSALYLRVQSKRDSWIHQVESVLDEIAYYEGYSRDVELVFGEFDFPTKKEKIRDYAEAWKNGGICLRDYQEILGIEPDEEFGDAYKWELQPEQKPEVELSEELKRKVGV